MIRFSFRNSKFVLSIGIIFSCVAIILLIVKVQKLQEYKKLLVNLPAGVSQKSSTNLEMPNDQDYILGNENAKVTLIEYSDFECPQCQMLHPLLLKLVDVYGENIRLVKRMFPLPQNKNAQKEAEAAFCAGAIGGNSLFWKYSDKIFQRTTGAEGGVGFSLEKLIPLAKELGINEEKFSQCLNNSYQKKRVETDLQSGEKAGVNQLPALFIIDKNENIFFITGNQSYPTLQTIIEIALKS